MNLDVAAMLLAAVGNAVSITWNAILASPQAIWSVVLIVGLSIVSALVPTKRRRRRYRY